LKIADGKKEVNNDDLSSMIEKVTRKIG